MSQELFETRGLLNRLLGQYPQHKEYLEPALSEVNKIIDTETDRMAKVLEDGKVPDNIANYIKSFLTSGKDSKLSFGGIIDRQALEVLTKIGIIEKHRWDPGFYVLIDETTARELLRKYNEGK